MLQSFRNYSLHLLKHNLVNFLTTVSDKNSWDTYNANAFFSLPLLPFPSQCCLLRFCHQIVYTNIEGTRRHKNVPTIFTETVGKVFLETVATAQVISKSSNSTEQKILLP